MIAVIAVLWGVAFVAIKELLRDLHPVTLVIIRFAVADALLLGIKAALPAVRPRFERRDWWRLGGLAEPA